MAVGTISEYVKQYADHVRGIEERIISEQGGNIAKAGRMICEAFQSGGNIFAFGPGHAGMFAEEMFYRAGGLAISALEVLPGYGSVVLEESPLRSGDVLLIHSVAARNPVVVEMAIKAREKGIKVISIVCMDYASQVTSRDPSGKMLQDVSDLVIDTCGDLGDACMTVSGIEQKVAPTSSVLGSFIANCLLLQICAYFLDAGITPPVFQSANVDGGGAYNAKLLEQYKDRIFYM